MECFIHLMIPLSQLNKGQVGKIVQLEGDKELVQRLLDIGLYKKDKVQLLDKLLFGKNLVILSRGGKYVLRVKEAQVIKVEVLTDASI